MAKPDIFPETARTIELKGRVGFDSLPYQLVKKAVQQGFQFNLLCVGETGIGKTTLIESLFNMKLQFEPCCHELNNVELQAKTFDMEEGGVNLKLAIVETAGFGDQLDKDKSVKVIVDYICEQMEKFLKEELKVQRSISYYEDTRIHACLYFISPTGHGLKALDIVALRELEKRTNVIPIIAKSDTISKDELRGFKTKILSELKTQNIPLYQFPVDDETVRDTNIVLNKLIPYAVVGSTDFVKKDNGKSVRCRQYPWGIVEVENEDHCDFVKLREALLRVNVDALQQRTHTKHYENYRRERLREMGVLDGDLGSKMLDVIAQKLRVYDSELADRDKNMKKEFYDRVSNMESELKHVDEALDRKERQDNDNFHLEMRKLDEEIARVKIEKERFEIKLAKSGQNSGWKKRK